MSDDRLLNDRDYIFRVLEETKANMKSIEIENRGMSDRLASVESTLNSTREIIEARFDSMTEMIKNLPFRDHAYEIKQLKDGISRNEIGIEKAKNAMMLATISLILAFVSFGGLVISLLKFGGLQ